MSCTHVNGRWAHVGSGDPHTTIPTKPSLDRPPVVLWPRFGNLDASLVPAPKQRNTEGEREAIKSGKSAEEIWPNEPNKAAQKDTDARWTIKIGVKVRHRDDGTPLPMIALPVFGYKVTYQHRPAFRLHPGDGGDVCLGRRWEAASSRREH